MDAALDVAGRAAERAVVRAGGPADGAGFGGGHFGRGGQGRLRGNAGEGGASAAFGAGRGGLVGLLVGWRTGKEATKGR